MSQVAEASRSRQHEYDISNDRTYGMSPLTEVNPDKFSLFPLEVKIDLSVT